MYAINVMDMTKDNIISTFLLSPVIKGRQTVVCEKDRIDGTGVILECTDEQSKAIIEVIRQKFGKNEFRVYNQKRTAWVRV